MKKFISVIFLFMFLFFLFPVTSAHASNNTLIYNSQDLENMRNNLDGDYVLVSDIDLSGCKNWEPVGNADHPFTGSFDGDGHEISNISIISEEPADIGFFGDVDGGTIQDVSISGSYRAELGDYSGEYVFSNIGGIAGNIKNTSINRCSFSGKISCDVGKRCYARSGGITTGGASTIANCAVNADIYASSNEANAMAAGICTWSEDVKIEKCIFSGSVVGKSKAGFVYAGGINASGGGTISDSVVVSDNISGTADDPRAKAYVNEIGNFTTLNNNKAFRTDSKEAVQQAVYTDLGWDFLSIWQMDRLPSLQMPKKHHPFLSADWDLGSNTWSFRNPLVTINKKIFKKAVPYLTDAQALECSIKFGLGAGCYGMSATAIVLNSYFQSPDDFAKSKVSEIKKLDKSNSLKALGFNALDYIKLMQASQVSEVLAEQREQTKNDLDALFQAVKNYEGGGPGIVVCIGSSEGGFHALWGIAATETQEAGSIEVYDCNHPGEKRYITLTKDASGHFNKWQYQLSDGLFIDGNFQEIWGTENADISYNDKNEMIYIIQTDQYAKETAYTQSEKATETGANLVEIDSNSVLCTAATRLQYYGKDPAETADSTENHKRSTDKLYWADDNDIKVTTQSPADQSLVILGYNEKQINVEGCSGEVDCNILNTDVTINGNKSDHVSILLSDNNADTKKEYVISSSNCNDSIHAELKDDVISIDGMNDGTIDLKVNDEPVGSQKFTAAEKGVKIQYNDDANHTFSTVPDEKTNELFQLSWKDYVTFFWKQILKLWNKLLYFLTKTMN